MKIGELVDFQNGYAFKSKDFQSVGDYKVIKIKEIKNGGVLFTKDTVSISDSYDNLNKFIVEDEDVLFALTGDPVSKPNPNSWVGRVALYSGKENAVLNQRVCKLVSKDNDFDVKYLYYFFRNKTEFYRLASIAKGSASQANISIKDIADTEIVLPSKKEQKSIIEILSTIDSKIEENERINKNLVA